MEYEDITGLEGPVRRSPSEGPRPVREAALICKLVDLCPFWGLFGKSQCPGPVANTRKFSLVEPSDYSSQSTKPTAKHKDVPA